MKVKLILKKLPVTVLLFATLVLAFLGVLSAVVSALLYALNSDFSGFLGNISTIISIILGAVSIVYTFISGKDTAKQLLSMTDSTKNDIRSVREDLGPKDNFGDENVTKLVAKIRPGELHEMTENNP